MKAGGRTSAEMAQGEEWFKQVTNINRLSDARQRLWQDVDDRNGEVNVTPVRDINDHVAYIGRIATRMHEGAQHLSEVVASSTDRPELFAFVIEKEITSMLDVEIQMHGRLLASPQRSGEKIAFWTRREGLVSSRPSIIQAIEAMMKIPKPATITRGDKFTATRIAPTTVMD